MNDEDLSLLNTLTCYDVDYTHESDAHRTRSTLDHFIVSDQLLACVQSVHCDHSALSASDHSALLMSLLIGVSSLPQQPMSRRGPIPLWKKASDAQVANYQAVLDDLVAALETPYEALRCDSPRCEAHTDVIMSYYKSLVDACLTAGRHCIPHSNANQVNARKPVPYWTTHVKPLKDKALFWHAIWKSCDSPTIGVVAQIRRSTRAKYHRALRFFKQNDNLARFSRMGEQFLQQDRADFWSEVKRMRGNDTPAPSVA